MKSTQLLSIVFSLIMFTGVTAGNTAFAESDDIGAILEGFCEMTVAERSDIVTDYALDDYAEKLAVVCEIGDDFDREDSLEEVIEAIELENIDDTDDESDDIIEDFEDCVEAGYPIMESFPEQCTTGDGQVFTNTEDDNDDIDDGDIDANRYDLDDRLEQFCEMTDEEKRQLFADHPKLEQFLDRLTDYCDLTDDERKDALEDFIDEHEDKFRKYHKEGMREHLARYCEMTDEDKRAFIAEHDKAEDRVDKMNRYCELDEDGRMDFIEEHRDEYKYKHSNKGHGNLREHFAMYCDMTEEERAEKMQMHSDLPEDLREKLANYCEMSEDEQDELRDSMRDRMSDFKSHMKGKMMDRPHHIDYDRMCELSESDRALEITDAAKLDRISDWCEMTPEEREDYKREHHDSMKDKKHDFDGMSDAAKDKHHKLKMSDKSDRLKAMIMDKRGISDERRDEIRMKFEAKYGDGSDNKRTEIKMKFKDHMKTMKFKMSDERKSDIRDRLAEMKAFKAELRERSSEMTDEEKQELREEFIEKAKDIRLAWISPRTQVTAGVDAAEVECREGFSLVMKASNGVPMCLKADTALKMIEKGIAVPVN